MVKYMKRSLLALMCVFLILGLGSYGLVKLIGTDIEPYTDKSTHTVVTSFYPEYIIAKNLLDNCDDINLINMTSETTGCLHDYQITSKDMKTLTTCDALIINGGDMEPFIDDITAALPSLPIIDSSKGIKLLEGTHTHPHHHDDDCDEDCDITADIHTEESTKNKYKVSEKDPNKDDDNHNEQDNEEDSHNSDTCSITYNSHIWLDPDNYLKQIKTISSNLCKLYPDYKQTISDNTKHYSSKVKELKKEIEKINNNKKDVIIFHDSFAYLAKSFNLNIIKTVSVDSDTSLSAGTIAEVINTINQHNIKIMISEKQFGDSITKNISKETNAKVYILDSLVTGEDDKDAYIEGMKANITNLTKTEKHPTVK